MTEPTTDERLARLAARRGPRPAGPAATARPRRSVHARIWTAGLSASAVFGGVALLAHGARPSLATPPGAPAELPPEALDAVDPAPGPGDAADPTTAPPVRITVVVVHQPASNAATAPEPTAPEPGGSPVTSPGPAPAPTRRPAGPVVTTAPPPPPPAPPRATTPATRAPAPRPVATTRPS